MADGISVANGVSETAIELGKGALPFHQILILGLSHILPPIKFDTHLRKRCRCKGGKEYRAAQFFVPLLIRLDTERG
jgi:hypothetical protein